MTSWMHHAKIAAGIGLCAYEAAALAVADAEALPTISDLSHRHPTVAVAVVAWIAAHLLRPWLFKGGRQPIPHPLR